MNIEQESAVRRFQPGQKRTVAFKLTSEQLAAYDEEGRPFVEHSGI
jgi:hypothetical protein